jgi:CHAD domain-containing protein
MPRTHEKRLAALKEALQPVANEDTMSAAGRKILQLNTIEMFQHEGGLNGDDAIHSVHQMRVATRRLRSAFRVLQAYFETKAVRPFERAIQKTASALGGVRDMDVLIENIKAHQATLDETQQTAFQPLIDHLTERREAARADLVDWLDSRDYKQFTRKFTHFLTTSDKGSIEPESRLEPHQVRHVAPVIFHQHLANVRAYDTVIPTDKHKILHQLRIEFKRLRYVLTFFSDVLGTSIEEYIEEVKAMQDHLGRLNDAIVARHYLPHDEAVDGQISAVAAYRDFLAAEIETVMAGVPEAWSHFNTRSVQRKLSDALLVLR